jgi:hypothetical protein
MKKRLLLISYFIATATCSYAQTPEALHEIQVGYIFNKNKTIMNGESVASQLYTNPTTQLTPIGLRAGKKTAAFVEIGYGYKGIANLGLSSRF